MISASRNTNILSRLSHEYDSTNPPVGYYNPSYDYVAYRNVPMTLGESSKDKMRRKLTLN